MKFAELIDSISWEELKNEPFLYIADGEEFRKKECEKFLFMFSKLIWMEPVETDMRIVIVETTFDEIDEDEVTLYLPYGRNGTRNKDLEDFEYLAESNDPEFANAEADYSIQYVAWEKWLGMEIDKQTLERYTATQIVASCMVDMSMFGFKREYVKNETELIRQYVETVQKMTPAEKMNNPEEVEQKVHCEKILSLLDNRDLTSLV